MHSGCWETCTYVGARVWRERGRGWRGETGRVWFVWCAFFAGVVVSVSEF
jgi:hypothetical protein